MPSQNNIEIEKQKLEKCGIDNDPNQLAVVAVDNSRDRIKINQDDFFLLPINCSICDGNICYESQYGRTFKLPCGCKFGKVCIDTWILVNGKCPMCYIKVDHELIFQPQQELQSDSEKLVYENARRNALEKNGVCREFAGYTVAASALASDALKSVANSVAKYITSSADIEVQQRSLQVDKIAPKMDLEDRKKLIQTVKIATGAAATATGYVANAVGSTLWTLGSLLAPTVRAKSKQILTERNVEDERADRMVDGAMEITKAAALSTGKVLRGLQNASAVVGSSLARIYEHNYGFKSGEPKSDDEEIAANTVLAAM